MSSVFSQIMAGQLPGNFIWEDELCVVISTIQPASAGHVLVVPREEIDNFIDADPALISHLFQVAQIIGKAQTKVFETTRAGIVVAGFDVPHLHIHVVPANKLSDMSMHSIPMGDPAMIRAAADLLRGQLVDSGYRAQVPEKINKISQ